MFCDASSCSTALCPRQFCGVHLHGSSPKSNSDNFRSTRNEMIRRIVGSRRSPDEEYVQWIQRCTRKARTLAAQANTKCWTTQHLEQKWVWAGKVARMNSNSWPYRASFWRDVLWQSTAGSARPVRAQRGRPFRWEDSIHKHCCALGWNVWRNAAANQSSWDAKAPSFASCFA